MKENVSLQKETRYKNGNLQGDIFMLFIRKCEYKTNI